MKAKTLVTMAVLMLVGAASSRAQIPLDADPGRAQRTRADLERLLETYEEVLQSPAYSGSVKERASQDADRIRWRLENGDFRLGDRIVLYVQGEPELPDTVSVQAGPLINLPLFGDISLAGVLRSEIEAHLTTELARFIRDPVVRAQGLMRMSIQGFVGAPGFYVVPADMLLSEALMLAGGPGGEARLDDLRVERGPEVLLEGDELQDALREGYTLDQLNLQAGDQIFVPGGEGTSFFTVFGTVAGLLGTLGWIFWRR